MPGWVPGDLPAGPGVYRFEGEGGTPLYVGKSVNVRRRVRGYFHGGGPDGGRMAEMVALARAVRVWPAGSDLEAKIEEAERILAERPRYNRALKNRARGWYLELEWRDPFPRPRVVRSARSCTARYFGPFRGRAAPDRIAGLVERVFRLRSCAGPVRPDADGSPCLARGLDLCTAPCTRSVGLDGYRAQAERAARALADPAAAAEERARLARKRDRASADLAYERAGWIQRRIEWLDELETLRGAIAGQTLEGSWLIALPHARAGRAVVVLMVAGRIVSREPVRWTAPGWRDRVADACYRARVAALRAGSVVEPEALVTGRIVTDWMLEGAPGGIPLDLDRHDDAAVAARLAAWWGGEGAG